MLNFLKSKKGFTLVELMVVVVIMAILVAVAVPIFSAVTENTVKRACIGNQREILSSLNNWLMLMPTEKVSGTITLSGGKDDPKWQQEAIKISVDGTEKDVTDEVKGMFKIPPTCPNESNKVVITIHEAPDADKKATVSTRCEKVDGGAVNTEHAVPLNESET